MTRRIVAISLGCPSGVGPEVSVLGADATRDEARAVLVGDRAVIERAAKLRGVSRSRIVAVHDEGGVRALTKKEIGWWEPSTHLPTLPEYGKPGQPEGSAQLAWVNEATDLVTSGVADALVTGPVSKAAIATSGVLGAEDFRGHTEHLGARLGASEVIMAFAGDALITALVTTHLAIANVPSAITREGVAASTYWLARLVGALRKTKKKGPVIAVASLNPHAGEAGLLGHEEVDTIAPGVVLARERLAASKFAAEVVGPIGAETAIRLAARGTYDGVLAMYHDQATIPSKLLGFGEAVNITLGLPIVRTSVDHGTGYDVAGTGQADPRGMIEAIEAAVKLVKAGIANKPHPEAESDLKSAPPELAAAQ
ncbi:MAG: 4-hydroxythreonine-4-phosphate dehydrogenase PdxA [Polyangiaceae bacterium]